MVRSTLYKIACQSGRSLAGAVLGLAIATAAPAALAGQTGWAHKDAAFTSNGAVTIKGLAGGAYTGTQNPAGAVTKVNQSAVTQPPTVIIQATSSAQNQAFPLIVAGTNTSPSCPVGYAAVFQGSGSFTVGNGFSLPLFNVAGTRFTMAHIFVSGGNYVGFTTDQLPQIGSSGSNYSASLPMVNVVPGVLWAATLCSK